MEMLMRELAITVEFSVGGRVQTLRGSLRGVIVRILDDGRVVLRPDGTDSEMIALPENLRPES